MYLTGRGPAVLGRELPCPAWLGGCVCCLPGHLGFGCPWRWVPKEEWPRTPSPLPPTCPGYTGSSTGGVRLLLGTAECFGFGFSRSSFPDLP